MTVTPANELTARCVIFAVGAALEADLAVVAALKDEAHAESPLDGEVYLAFLEFAQRVKALERRREAGHGREGQV